MDSQFLPQGKFQRRQNTAPWPLWQITQLPLTKGCLWLWAERWQSTPIIKHGSSNSRSATQPRNPTPVRWIKSQQSCLDGVLPGGKKTRLKLSGSLPPEILIFSLLIMKRIQLRSVPEKGTIPDFGRFGNSSSTTCFWLCSLSAHISFPCEEKAGMPTCQGDPAHMLPAWTVLFWIFKVSYKRAIIQIWLHSIISKCSCCQH